MPDPWDDDSTTTRLVEVVAGLPRQPLATIEAPRRPGVYLLFYSPQRQPQRPGRLAEILGLEASTARVPIYVGVSDASLRARCARYRQMTADLVDLALDDLWVATLPVATPGWAAYAERTLIGRLAPPLQGLGLGCRVPGARRTTQRCSPIDALLPGRAWARPPSLRDEALARLTVATALLAMPEEPRWAPL